MRLKDRVAIVVGAGQSPGEGIGNGRATALTFAREGAKVLCVDHNLASAQETVEMIRARQGTAEAFKADVTRNADIKAMVADAHNRWGKIDILHNNVGVSLSGGDAELLDITEEAFDRCVAINLKSCILAAKHVIPIMRQQMSGVIINISSMAAITTYPYVAYKATKSAMISFTEQLAYQNAPYGIRANVILPGLMNTPMAVDTRAREFKKSRAEVEAERDRKVPLRQKMGTGWDVANAALFLASDEASFITGVTLPVDGGASVRRGRSILVPVLFLGAADRGAAPGVDRRQALEILSEIGETDPQRRQIDRLRQTLSLDSQRSGESPRGRTAGRLGATDDDDRTRIIRLCHHLADIRAVTVLELQVENHAIEGLRSNPADRLAA